MLYIVGWRNGLLHVVAVPIIEYDPECYVVDTRGFIGLLGEVVHYPSRLFHDVSYYTLFEDRDAAFKYAFGVLKDLRDDVKDYQLDIDILYRQAKEVVRNAK